MAQIRRIPRIKNMGIVLVRDEFKKNLIDQGTKAANRNAKSRIKASTDLYRYPKCCLKKVTFS